MQALGLIETRGLIAAIEGADTMLKAADVTLIDKTYVGGGLVSIAVIGGVAAVKAAVEAGAAAVKKINDTLLVSQHVIPRPHDEIDELLTTKKTVKKAKNRFEAPASTEFVAPTGPTSIEEGSDSTIEDLANSNSVLKEPVTVEPVVEQLVPEVLVQEEPLDTLTVAENLVTEEQVTEEQVTEEQVTGEPVTGEQVIEEQVSESSTVKPVAVYPEIKKTVLPDIKPEDINKTTIDRIVLEHGAAKAIEFLSTLRVTKLRSLAREYENMGIAGREISRADGKTLISEFEKYYD